MSVIACRVDEQGIVSLAVDSQVSYDDYAITRGRSLADQKMWVTPGGVLIAFCGSSGMGALLRRWTREQTPEDAAEAGMTAFVDAFHVWRREHYQEAGDVDELSFIAAYQGRAWVVDQYSVSEVPSGGYMAHGSGLPVALGALYCGASVIDAVRAAAAHQSGCGLPVVWATITREGAVAGSVERMEALPAIEESEAA